MLIRRPARVWRRECTFSVGRAPARSSLGRWEARQVLLVALIVELLLSLVQLPPLAALALAVAVAVVLGFLTPLLKAFGGVLVLVLHVDLAAPVETAVVSVVNAAIEHSSKSNVASALCHVLDGIGKSVAQAARQIPVPPPKRMLRLALAGAMLLEAISKIGFAFPPLGMFAKPFAIVMCTMLVVTWLVATRSGRATLDCAPVPRQKHLRQALLLAVVLECLLRILEHCSLNMFGLFKSIALFVVIASVVYLGLSSLAKVGAIFGTVARAVLMHQWCRPRLDIPFQQAFLQLLVIPAFLARVASAASTQLLQVVQLATSEFQHDAVTGTCQRAAVPRQRRDVSPLRSTTASPFAAHDVPAAELASAPAKSAIFFGRKRSRSPVAARKRSSTPPAAAPDLPAQPQLPAFDTVEAKWRPKFMQTTLEDAFSKSKGGWQLGGRMGLVVEVGKATAKFMSWATPLKGRRD